MGTYPVFGQTERWIPRVRLLKHRCSGRRSQEKRELLKEAASEIRKAGQSCRGLERHTNWGLHPKKKAWRP